MNVHAAPVPGSACGADLLGQAQAYRAIDWTHNDNGGTNTGATIANTTIFASGTAENLSNMDAYINAYDLLVNRAFIPPTLDTSKYISYTFTTTALSGVTAELLGFGAAVFNVTSGYPDNSTITGAYKVRIDIDDDPAFTSPITLETNALIDNFDIINNNPNSNADLFENQPPERWLTYGYLHFTADTVINLQPNTTYTVRVYPYEDTRSGNDGWPTPHNYPEFVVWDDFSLKAISCAKIDAKADTPASIDSNTGGSTPSVVINDELGGVVNPPIGTAAGEVILNRTGTAQDGTTSLGLVSAPAAGSITMGTDGTITATPNTTAGTYQYTYEICEAANSSNCDIAVATVVVVQSFANLSVVKTLDTTGPYISGQSIIYTLTVSNVGPDTATNVTVEDLPTNLTNLTITSASTCPTGSVTAGVICTITSLAAGASEIITVQATAP